MTNTILQVENLNKSYPIGKSETQPVLRDVSLSIDRGEFVCVMGASGSGKSTLMYNISGMESPDSGSIRFLKKELTDLSQQALAALRLNFIGYIFQQSNLLRSLNLFDNIILPAYEAKKEPRETVNERCKRLMAELGISDLAENSITQASGGQLQRTAICRALINKPEFLFGDEPTGALNSSTTAEVMDILADINAKGTTILLVTHDAKVAARSSRVLFMTDGRITAEKELGQFRPGKDDIRQREAALSEWLFVQGF